MRDYVKKETITITTRNESILSRVSVCACDDLLTPLVFFWLWLWLWGWEWDLDGCYDMDRFLRMIFLKTTIFVL
jgi:hypothetical protein